MNARRYFREPNGSASRALWMARHYMRMARRYRPRSRSWVDRFEFMAAWYVLWAVKKVVCGVF